jgi:hypothetical protein
MGNYVNLTEQNSVVYLELSSDFPKNFLLQYWGLNLGSQCSLGVLPFETLHHAKEIFYSKELIVVEI